MRHRQYSCKRYHTEPIEVVTVDEDGLTAEADEDIIQHSQELDEPYYCRKCERRFKSWPEVLEHLEQATQEVTT